MAIAPAKLRMGAASQMLLGSQDLGASKGGMILKYNPKYMALKCDQALAPVAAFKSEEECSIETTIYQVQMALVSAAYGVFGLGDVTTTGGSPNKDQFTFGGRVYTPIFTFDAPVPKNDNTSNNVVVHLHKVYSSKGASLNFARDKDTAYTVEFDCLADPSQAAGQQLGYVYEQY